MTSQNQCLIMCGGYDEVCGSRLIDMHVSSPEAIQILCAKIAECHRMHERVLAGDQLS